MKIPSELSLPKASFPDSAELLKNLDKMKENSLDSSGITLPVSFVEKIISIAINIWRIQSRILSSETGDPKEEIQSSEVRKIARNMESITNCFQDIGLEIIDRKGQQFDYGLPEKVVTAKQTPGISKEIVLETIIPTIKWKDKIFAGEVEIATPINSENN
ncbi:MAG: hypothetical protein NTZ94_02205 [Verrucomicrobia bacterium]|nr:hypothetical protein [Verrucomicrobiota bacterium]